MPELAGELPECLLDGSDDGEGVLFGDEGGLEPEVVHADDLLAAGLGGLQEDVEPGMEGQCGCLTGVTLALSVDLFRE